MTQNLVRVNETVEFMQCCEVVVPAIIDKSIETDFIFIPNNNKLNRKQFSAASAIYSGRKTQSMKIPIRVINPMISKNTLYKGTIVGKIVPLEEKLEFDNSCNNLEDDSKISKGDLINQIMNNHEKLQPDAYNELKQLITRFSDIFSRSSTDVRLHS